MGILDDAIREHLDLKRRHGAEEDEVQILEQEAFGPPSRPGEPDFPDRPPTGEEAVVEEAPTGAEDVAAPEAAAPEVEEAPPVVEDEAPVAEELAAPEPDLPAGFYDHQAGETSLVEEPTIEHPPPPPPEDEAEPLPAEPAEEPAAAAPPEDSGEFEIGEIELELDEEFEEFRETEDEPAAEAELETPVSDESDEFTAVEVDRPEEEERTEVAPAGDGEDVLEETPEFLRDTPEDERLWFEQGSPQDFDFDEDEEDEDEGR